MEPITTTILLGLGAKFGKEVINKTVNLFTDDAIEKIKKYGLEKVIELGEEILKDGAKEKISNLILPGKHLSNDIIYEDLNIFFNFSKDEFMSIDLKLNTITKSLENLHDKVDKLSDTISNTCDELNSVDSELSVSMDFCSFLENTELLTQAHSQKDKVFLDDIFVYPELDKFDGEEDFSNKVNFKDFLNDFNLGEKILVAGESQSGRTTMCKKLFIELRNKNYIPIYISGENLKDRGNINVEILKSYSNQYTGPNFDKLDKNKIIPIIDDFYLFNNKNKQMEYLSVYDSQFIFVDDIFSLNIKNENLTSSYVQYKIREFGPTLRNNLIEKWVNISEKSTDLNFTENDRYLNIDKITCVVDNTLGKVLGEGVMPSFPFFILSIISSHEVLEKPLTDITSQGYCYESLIYLYLKKNGVKSNEVGTYITFLTEFSFHFYKNKLVELKKHEFETFIKSYSDRFNVYLKIDEIIDNLEKSNIIVRDSFNVYSFKHSYLYYFFVAKFLAENMGDDNDFVDSEIDKILSNLHKNENAYIAIFITHHSKNKFLLRKIIKISNDLFDKSIPSTLNKHELKIFDDIQDLVIDATLPKITSTPEVERKKELELKEKRESVKKNRLDDSEFDDELSISHRRSFKTVEVMGAIFKNHSGSLEKEKLELIFQSGINLYLRILNRLLKTLSTEEALDFIEKSIKDGIDKKFSDSEKKPSVDELKEISKEIYSNLIFFLIFSIIDKIIHSFGSDQLLKVVDKVCDEVNTPALFLVKQGINMWYGKNLYMDEIDSGYNDKNFSVFSKKIIKYMVVYHCRMHKLNYKDKQRVNGVFGIPIEQIKKIDEKKTTSNNI